MFARALHNAHSTVVLCLTQAVALGIISKNDKAADDYVIAASVSFLQGELPQNSPEMSDTYQTVNVSLKENEAKSLLDGDADFEAHYLEIISQQVENCHRGILTYKAKATATEATGYSRERRKR